MNASTLLRLTALAAAIGFSVAHAATVTVAPTVASKIHATSLENNGRYDRFIVTYRDGTTERTQSSIAVQGITAAIARANLRASAASATGNPLGVNWKRKLAIGADLMHTSRKLNRTEAMSLMQQIAADPAVARVEPDVLMHPVKDFAQSPSPGGSTPNDPLNVTNHLQWHMQPGDGTPVTVGNDTNAYANWGGSNVAPAWASYDGSGVTVAVIDTGVTHHGDLNETLTGNGYDMINDAFVSGRAADGRVPGGWDTGDWTTGPVYTDPVNGCVDPSQAEDSSWHGTHVFGTIAAKNNNGVGVDGVATNAQVVPIRALGHCGGYTSDIADSITWASGGHVDGVPDNAYPAQVISMSLGGSGVCDADDATGTVITGAIARGATVVVAAGNSSSDAASFTPASCPGVISVASVGITGRRAFYSNYGSTVTIAAPGGGIYANDASAGTQVDAGFDWSTLNDGATVEGNAVFGGMAGTSQATPHVSGIVALMIEAVKEAGHATLTPDQIRLALVNSARPFHSTPDHPIGSGIVDASAAINAAININSVAPSIVLSPGVAATASGKAGASMLYRIDVPGGATNLTLRTLGGSGDVSLYVKRGNPPGSSGAGADFSSVKPGNNETVIQTAPAAGSWYLLVVGVKDFSGVQVLANFTAH